MEAVQLFQIYRVCSLKESQITVRRNNDDLGLFLYSTFRVRLDLEGGQSFLSCHSPMRFVFCYQGSWFISEHFVGKDIGYSMGYERTFF